MSITPDMVAFIGGLLAICLPILTLVMWLSKLSGRVDALASVATKVDTLATLAGKVDTLEQLTSVHLAAQAKSAAALEEQLKELRQEIAQMRMVMIDLVHEKARELGRAEMRLQLDPGAARG